MPIPTPPLDTSGGHILIKATNGVVAHRMRFHVLDFNADATGTYVAPPAGGEASVQATAAAVMSFLAPFYSTNFTLSLDAVFDNIPPAPPIEVFNVVAPAPVVGTVPPPDGPVESFDCLNWRSTNGRRGRVFILTPAQWVYSPAVTVAANAAGGTTEKFVAYLVNPHTAIVCHDGGKPVAPMRETKGLNKRLRRHAGNA